MRGDIEFWESFSLDVDNSWRKNAACVDSPGDLFFDESLKDEAQAICDTCSVWAQCVDDAIRFDDYGHRGLSHTERLSIAMHRKRNIKAFKYDLGMLDE
jgi:hypothetical protein